MDTYGYPTQGIDAPVAEGSQGTVADPSTKLWWLGDDLTAMPQYYECPMRAETTTIMTIIGSRAHIVTDGVSWMRNSPDPSRYPNFEDNEVLKKALKDFGDNLKGGEAGPAITTLVVHSHCNMAGAGCNTDVVNAAPWFIE